MNILIIGSGGREHAIFQKIKSSGKANNVFISPGNGGTNNNVYLDLNDLNSIDSFCRKNDISFVIIGPEQPLANGLSDFLRRRNIDVFGPSQAAAKLESSKSFAKEIMAQFDIPTAKYKSFVKSELEQAKLFINSFKGKVVLKADGLAAGKGVIICEDSATALIELEDMFAGKFGAASDTIVIEEFLDGIEASVFVISDGKEYFLLPPAQDHKKAFDGNKGPNTGGMGAFAPSPFITDEIEQKIHNQIISPLLKGLHNTEYEFQGCLFCGLMIVGNQPYVIEFNVRFGDPETQAVLELVQGDFLELLYSSAKGKIDTSAISYNNLFACNVVLASEGYPGKYDKDKEIKNLNNITGNNHKIFHAGTKKVSDKIFSNGGRVLSAVGIGDNLNEAITNAYTLANEIDFENKFNRTDIGSVIER